MSVICRCQIDGDYKGWNGSTIYRLTNGQKWKQAHYFYHYNYSYYPSVTVTKTTSGRYEMRVGGDSYVAEVVQVW